ncbi:HPr(Ser) kinase/phosphatase [Paludicola sp. MB14-C6]|uniref:HPr(Ser) kinase/phosphatase n=1 Tax=Paludihabitans sp. MB14-C6 TaxID=3070656 RepID=UPI0027DCAF34|nr:HPr(Ser) kinase/phosphatase [Paludicola sp. MB14-C6]WMJ23496.1 HPr(Ser) kinase/phosphatase [Paludicola sp. MB14-C6]
MSTPFTVPLSKIIKDFGLETIYLPEGKEILLQSTDVNRPGLNLTGFLEHFDKTRIQIFGLSENSYLETLSHEVRKKRLDDFFALNFPALVISRGLEVFEEIMDAAKANGVAVLRTNDTTSGFLSGLISYLNVELAPRITRHGVLIEAYGEGVLLLGESGVGKSETAIELVKRGHRLIADDAVEIRRVSNRTLVGSSPENIRHFLELRGVGIINARRLFGMGSVKITEKIDMIVKLELWDPDKTYDRMGMENEYATILGIQVPCITIPVKPGRNLAIILEVAAMNNRQKKMGYNAAQELMHNLGMPVEETTSIKNWDIF